MIPFIAGCVVGAAVSFFMIGLLVAAEEDNERRSKNGL